MSKAPLVSVIMPSYNCGEFIAASIDSVLRQSMTDWELLIVDDRSGDDTEKVVKPYTEQNPNIHFTCLSRHGGPAAARTEAIRQARGKYCAFLDSDDLWLPEKLEKQTAFMKDRNVYFSCTAFGKIDSEGNNLHTVMVPPKMTDYKKCIRLSNPIGNLTVMYDQEALGKFTVPMIERRNDFALWLKILKTTEFCYGMEDTLAMYRVRGSGSLSNQKVALAKYHWQLYHEIEGHNLLRSAYEMGCWAFVKGTGIGLEKRHV